MSNYNILSNLFPGDHRAWVAPEPERPAAQAHPETAQRGAISAHQIEGQHHGIAQAVQGALQT